MWNARIRSEQVTAFDRHRYAERADRTTGAHADPYRISRRRTVDNEVA
jgi:hypothetical protein